MTQKNSGENVGCTLGLLFLGVIGFVLYYVFFTPDNEKLASKYNVPVERVHASPKPHGCAFSDSPLGEKHCHYEEHVYVYDKNDQVLLKDGDVQPCVGCGTAWSVYQNWMKVEE